MQDVLSSTDFESKRTPIQINNLAAIVPTDFVWPNHNGISLSHTLNTRHRRVPMQFQHRLNAAIWSTLIATRQIPH